MVATEWFALFMESLLWLPQKLLGNSAFIQKSTFGLYLQASCLPSFSNCTMMLYLMIENTLVRTYMTTVLVRLKFNLLKSRFLISLVCASFASVSFHSSNIMETIVGIEYRKSFTPWTFPYCFRILYSYTSSQEAYIYGHDGFERTIDLSVFNIMCLKFTSYEVWDLGIL